MGFVDIIRGRVALPRFSVSVFGKLPCHKEYFFVSDSPAFSELKSRLDAEFEALARSGRPRPYVCPDRFFFLKTADRKTDLAGGVWESDDGKRGFPFIMAAPTPRRVWSQPFPVFWQTLSRIWDYLDAYFTDLRGQREASEVYRRVRGVAHELPPFKPEPWPEPEAPAVLPLDLNGTALAREDDGAERGLLRKMAPKVNPAWILWPVPTWRDQLSVDAAVRFGERGLDDVRIDDFPPPTPEAALRAPEASDPSAGPAASVQVDDAPKALEPTRSGPLPVPGRPAAEDDQNPPAGA